MQFNKLTLVIILSASLLVNGIQAFLSYKEVVRENQREVNLQSVSRVIYFQNLFIKKILMADTEVDFNTRMELETSVRNLQDPEILASWEQFTKSQTKEDASAQAKKLMALLIAKSTF